MAAGSAPRAMITGIFAPFAAISRQCAAPTLWRCQCMATVFLPMTWTRYIPTFRIPRDGSSVITIGKVMNGPPSKGQVVSTGSRVRST